eukprot:g6486.t1
MCEADHGAAVRGLPPQPLHQQAAILILERRLAKHAFFGGLDDGFALGDLVILAAVLPQLARANSETEAGAAHFPRLLRWAAALLHALVACGALLRPACARVPAWLVPRPRVRSDLGPGRGTEGLLLEVRSRAPTRLGASDKRRRRRARRRDAAAALRAIGRDKLLPAGLLRPALRWATPAPADAPVLHTRAHCGAAAGAADAGQAWTWRQLPLPVDPGASLSAPLPPGAHRDCDGGPTHHGCGSGGCDGGGGGGGGSAGRAERKRGQVRALLAHVLPLLPPGGTLVEFCSGCGHVGLVAAALRTDATVVLSDQNAVHLAHARARADEAGLLNVQTLCGDMRALIGGRHFDVGTALHACGAATDLALEACVRAGAAFAVVPCCYGWLQNHAGAEAGAEAGVGAGGVGAGGVQAEGAGLRVSYPRSRAFADAGVGAADMAVVSACADATYFDGDERAVRAVAAVGQEAVGAEEAGTGTEADFAAQCSTLDSRGRTCMAIIDSDRLLRCSEAQPPYRTSAHIFARAFTPKNHILVGSLASLARR